jgi:thioredoxin reductase
LHLHAQTKTKNIYDYIIIGGGISGLYTGYTLQQKHPHASFLILEKNTELGGRTNNSSFGGTEVMEGAHVGRLEKDHLLYDLVKKLKIPHELFSVEFHYTPDFTHQPDFIMNHVKELQKKYISYLETQFQAHASFHLPSFKEFAISIMGEKTYDYFIHATGYTDYQREHAFEVLFHYGMEDNNQGWTGIKIPWDTLHEKLAETIGAQHIKNEHVVQSIDYTQNAQPEFTVFAKNKNKNVSYQTKNIIFALPVGATNTILQKSKTLQKIMSPISEIRSQNFVRIYGDFKPRVIELLEKYIPKHSIVYSPLHYVIPMNAQKGVYLLACSDNTDADLLRTHSKNTKANRSFFEKEVETAFKMPAGSLHNSLEKIHAFHWQEGTHYMVPPHSEHIIPHYMQEKDVKKALQKHKNNTLAQIRHPHPHIFLVGEGVSDNRGWVHEALKSVEYIMKKI